MSKPQPIRVYQDWVDRIQSEAELTEWEEDFIESIDRQLSKGNTLSPKQADVLERIYAEKTK